MCGIMGSLGVGGFADADVKFLAHRGPDGSGVYRDGQLFLGHTRLAIQDTSDAAAQPMESPCGRYVLTYNGEIYNHLQLRSNLLDDVEFSSTGDTETLLWGLIKHGVEFLESVNGMYAFGFYDRDEHRLIVVRDPVGIKPLYYTATTGLFAFASELKALKGLPGVDLTADPDALMAYLQLLYAPGELTPVLGIRKLEPGHIATVMTEGDSAGQIEIRRYATEPWRSLNVRKATSVDLEAVLLAAVERQMLSDRPVGFFLSGGVDSSLIVAMARKILGPNAALPCFTVKSDEMAEEGFVSDLPYARLVAEHVGAELHEVEVGTPTAAELAEMVWILDEPQPDFAPLAVRAISRAAASLDIPVLLSGAGGDDIFTGYRRHVAGTGRLAHFAIRVPVGAFVSRIGRIIPSGSLARRLLRTSIMLEEASRYPTAARFAWLSSAEATELVSTLVALPVSEPVLARLEAKADESGLTNLLDRMLAVEACGFLPDHNLNYTDKMGMIEGVEIRVPYLDKLVIDTAWGMQRDLLTDGRQTKIELRNVASRYLPPAILNRAKTGFGGPVVSWLNAFSELDTSRQTAMPRVRALRDAGSTYPALALYLMAAAHSTQLQDQSANDRQPETPRS